MAAVAAMALALLAAPVAAQANGSLSGTVTAHNDGTPLPNVAVCVFSQVKTVCPAAVTDEEGKYTVAELPKGTYGVSFAPLPPSGYVTQYYNGASSYSELDPVELQDGEEKTGINASLFRTSTIEGTVTDQASGSGIAGAEACVYRVLCGTTEASGAYSIEGLSPGEYQVEFLAPGYIGEFWHDKRTAAEADPVVVGPEEAVTGINAGLSKPVPPAQEPPPAMSEPPALFPTGSTTTSTPPRRKRCKKGFRRKRVRGHYRCVKKHRKRRARQARRAHRRHRR
jgi:hypothetical protein